jgi:CRP/FNR family cyclic AMP-dependent transcriptional regulator
MSTAIGLNYGLQDEDLLWMYRNGVKRVADPGCAIVEEGTHPNAIFLVIRGKFSVRVANVAEEPLAILRPGEVIGEISFLEGSPASATIVSEAESAVLVIDNALLNERICEDTPFAARLYRSFALIAERRLRNRVNQLAPRYAMANAARDQSGICGRAAVEVR